MSFHWRAWFVASLLSFTPAAFPAPCETFKGDAEINQGGQLLDCEHWVLKITSDQNAVTFEHDASACAGAAEASFTETLDRRDGGLYWQGRLVGAIGTDYLFFNLRVEDRFASATVTMLNPQVATAAMFFERNEQPGSLVRYRGDLRRSCE